MKKIRVIATPKLKERRQEVGTQEEFVDVIKLYQPKLTRSAYATYELGTRTVELGMAKTIAHILNRPLNKLFKIDQ
jgi:transcriptional regulator with XRE-family HTH domain